MRILALVCPGDYQAYLVGQLRAQHELCGYVLHTTRPLSRMDRLRARWKRYRNPYLFLDHFLARRETAQQDRNVEELHRSLFSGNCTSPRFPDDVEHLHVHDVNDAACCNLIRRLQPEAIVVNGTNLLRDPVFAVAESCRYGIINIHTGLSPYSRGGSCNLHAIMHRQIQYVGVTVHYIDKGIDSGDIIFTDRPTIALADTIESIEEKNFRLGIDLLLLALEEIREGVANRVKQWTTGRLFLRRTGYEYSPRLRVLANRILQEEGLLRQYLAHKAIYDERVRLITSPRSRALSRVS